MRIDYNVILDDIERVAKRYPDIIRQETLSVLDDITAMLESDVVVRTPAGVGGAAGLRGSIEGTVTEMRGVATGIVGTAIPYGEVIEYGRKPGKFPPTGPLELWVRRKLGVNGDKAPGVAFLVARKIAKKGFKGAHMFSEAWEADKAQVFRMLRTIPERVMRRMK